MQRSTLSFRLLDSINFLCYSVPYARISSEAASATEGTTSSSYVGRWRRGPHIKFLADVPSHCQSPKLGEHHCMPTSKDWLTSRERPASALAQCRDAAGVCHDEMCERILIDIGYLFSSPFWGVGRSRLSRKQQQRDVKFSTASIAVNLKKSYLLK